jgi:hypothetical protein
MRTDAPTAPEIAHENVLAVSLVASGAARPPAAP